jgi:gliding motility-associated-like protein
MWNRLLRSFLLLFALFTGNLLLAQTNLRITNFNTVDLSGTPTLLICPGSTHDLTFTIDNGQINAFGVVQVIITDKNNAANPINGTVIGSFNNGASPITPPAVVSIPVVTIPPGLPTSDYLFTLFVNGTQVTPAPALSNTVERQLIPNPRANIILDTVDTRYDNIFLTDSLSRLLTRFPGGGPVVPGGVAPIPAGVAPDPFLFKDSTVNFCAGDSLFIWNADSLSANAHNWLLDGSPIPGLLPNQGHLWVTSSGYYSLHVTSSVTCEDSSSAISVGDPDLNFGSGVFPRNKSIYFNAYSVDTTLFRIGPGNLSGPGGTLGRPTRFCEGDSMILAARGTSSHPLGSYAYFWVKDALDTLNLTTPQDSFIVIKDPGNYQAFITEYFIQGTGTAADTVFTCMAESNPVTIIVDPLPNAGITPPLQTLYCYGDTVDMQYSFPNQSFNTYTWILNDQPMNFGRFADTNFIRVDTATFSLFGIDVDTSAYFQIRVTDTLGCDSLSDPVRIDFTPYPNIRFVPNQRTFNLCPGDTLEVNAVVDNGVAVATRRWYESPSNNLITNTGLLRTGDEGTYYFEAITNDGCVKYDTVTVSYYSVTADAGPDVNVLTGETFIISGSGGRSYTWQAELGKPIAVNTFFNQTISVSYTLPDSLDADTIKMYLTVTDNNGCSDIDSMRIFVSRGDDPVSGSGLDRAYNLFSPNGDGYNDMWDITSVYRDGDVCKIQIINRWGSPVYTQENFSGLWDGSDDGGNPLPDGTYYYVLSCNDQVRVKSAVTLMRNQ